MGAEKHGLDYIVYVQTNPIQRIEEWEDYLRAKNNNLTFTQFVKRRRWRISPKRVSGNYNDYLYALRDAQLKAKEFLSTDEMAYVKQLLTAIEDMEATCVSLLSESRKINRNEAPEAYKAAKIAKDDALRKWRFACRWKFIVDGDIPQDIHTIIAEQIMHELRYVRRKRENRRSMYPDMEEFDVAKVRMYKDAVAFGAIMPVGSL
jgi:hypothetical protein